jgi:glucose-1-phosphate thymidylyltransferase
MINHGRKIFTAEVGGWYDCGKVETLLETNLHLLTHGRARRPAVGKGVTLQDPVYVADGVRLERCSVGPNVAIDEGTVVRGGSLRDAIVGRNALIEDCTVTRSVIGDGARLRGKTLDEMIATDDELAKAP